MHNKILILRSEPQARRLVALTLADAGYDIRPFGTPDEAIACARQELFDLVVVDQSLGELAGLDWIEQLRRVQPTVPVFLIAEKLDFSAVVKGIRLGVADVLNQPGDAAFLLRRTDLLLRPECAAVDGGDTGDERLSAALQAVLAQPERQNDGQLLQKEREALAADWAAIHEEQLRLRKERHRLRNEAMAHEGELTRFEAACAEFERRREADRARLDRAQDDLAHLDAQRRQMDADVETLREQENNLRDYEARLRQLQRELETEQISRTREREGAVATASEMEVNAAWNNIQRASAVLEAERKNMVDERLAIKDHIAVLNRREKEFEQRETRLVERERLLAALPALPAPAKSSSPFFSRAPFAAAKSILSLGRSG